MLSPIDHEDHEFDFPGVVNRVRHMRAYEADDGHIHDVLVQSGLDPARAHFVMRAASWMDETGREGE